MNYPNNKLFSFYSAPFCSNIDSIYRKLSNVRQIWNFRLRIFTVVSVSGARGEYFSSRFCCCFFLWLLLLVFKIQNTFRFDDLCAQLFIDSSEWTRDKQIQSDNRRTNNKIKIVFASLRRSCNEFFFIARQMTGILSVTLIEKTSFHFRGRQNWKLFFFFVVFSHVEIIHAIKLERRERKEKSRKLKIAVVRSTEKIAFLGTDTHARRQSMKCHDNDGRNTKREKNRFIISFVLGQFQAHERSSRSHDLIEAI